VSEPSRWTSEDVAMARGFGVALDESGPPPARADRGPSPAEDRWEEIALGWICIASGAFTLALIGAAAGTLTYFLGAKIFGGGK
jgi:hypothetical protein